MEEGQHFPAQQEDGQEDHHHGHQFAETQTASGRFETPGGQAENVEGGKAEHDCPENIVNILPRSAIKQGDGYAEEYATIEPCSRIERNCGPCSLGEARDHRHCASNRHSVKWSGLKDPRQPLKGEIGYYIFFLFENTARKNMFG